MLEMEQVHHFSGLESPSILRGVHHRESIADVGQNMIEKEEKNG